MFVRTVKLYFSSAANPAPVVAHSRMSAMRVMFDVMHLYYLPQYLPVHRELQRRGATTEFVLYDDAAALVATQEGLHAHRVRGADEAAALYAGAAPDWVVFGNNFAPRERLAPTTLTATLYHGIGVKDCYYDSPLMQTTVRFCEGEYRRAELLRRFPRGPAEVLSVGFAKLDPLLAPSSDQDWPDLADLGLPVGRPTVLYAPTYYPSSIECLPSDFPATLSDLNLVIKPHQFTLSKTYYREQRRRLESWHRFPNVYVAGSDEYSLLPFMRLADVLVSEASSAMFEFAALDRPIVWCDFVKLRWTHRGPLRGRFERRMDRSIERYADIGAHVASPEQLVPVIRQELANPDRLQRNRAAHVAELIGPTDGQASQRIADRLFATMSG